MAPISKVVSAIALAAIAFDVSFAHPGHDHQAEAEKRAAQIATSSKRSLSHCAEKLVARGHEAKAISRRSAWAKELRQKRALQDLPFLKGRAVDPLSISHKSNRTDLTANSTDGEVFGSNTGGCILQPEVTEGPYYVNGELIRYDVHEDQAGIPLYADVQFLDMSTCEPLPNVYTDWWHCNSTGVYSGVSASGNGNSDTVTSNLNATFLRGIQSTDSDGVVRFESLIPGHYTGRTPHVHILAHVANTTANANGTITSVAAQHVGQLFFDQSLINETGTISPYSANTQTLTTNAEDGILLQETASSDPILEYVLLGDTLADGIFAWISIGINTTYSYHANAAATLTADGGVANANAMGGGPPPNGTAGPAGTGVPTGTAPAMFKLF